MKLFSILAILPGVAAAPTCEYFTAQDCGTTNSALKNYGSCSFDACGGDFVAIDMLSCVNDPYLRLYSSDGSLLAFNDVYNSSKCSYLEFVLPDGADCMSYEARLGCYGNSSDCEGRLSINISGG